MNKKPCCVPGSERQRTLVFRVGYFLKIGPYNKLYYTWQRKLYEVTVSASDTFVEVPLAPQPISRISVATVSMSGVTAEIHNGADEATLAALFRAMKSC
jgi:hypothetical protein